jgi:hypothetical protein
MPRKEVFVKCLRPSFLLSAYYKSRMDKCIFIMHKYYVLKGVMTALLVKYYSDNQIKEDEKVVAGDTQGRGDKVSCWET